MAGAKNLGLLVASACCGVAASTKIFTVWSDPIFLHRGEVHNAWVRPKAMPADISGLYVNKTIHMKSMQLDIVRVDNASGAEVVLPLYQVYNHHHALLVGPTADLERVYNYSKHNDPLNPRGHGHAVSAVHEQHHHGSGCMMHGSGLRDLLNEVAHFDGGRKLSIFGGASGAEFRGTTTAIPAPFTYAVNSPESFMVLMHFINTRDEPHKAKLWECPCTKARNINVTNGTIDGMKPLPFQCSEQLLREGNTACNLRTYQGGYRCCEDGVYLTESLPKPGDAPDQIQAKFSFEYYEESELANFSARAVTSPSCCDATADPSHTHFGNVEYDIPQCEPGTRPDLCVHEISSVQPFSIPSNRSGRDEPVDPNEELDLVHAWGHQHVGALSLELYRESTGELLCRTTPVYGAGSAPGDEAGFLTGIPPCVFGPPPLREPPRLRRRDTLRTVARYNSTQRRHGVMSLWLLKAAVVSPKVQKAHFLV